MAPQIVEEPDEAFGVVAARLELEEELRALGVPAIRHHRGRQHLLPVERMDQDWRFAAGCPGATDRRLLGDPALVLEGNPSLLALGFFLTAGQRWATHRRIASSLRSRARRAGRCQRPAHRPQDSPHMTRVIADARHSLDHLRDSRQRPQICVLMVRARAPLAQCDLHLSQLFCLQARHPAGSACPAQRLGAPALPLTKPSAHALPADSELASHRRQSLSIGKQAGRPLTPQLQRLEV